MKPLKRGRPEDDEDIDDYIPSDSEDEYTEAEKRLLEKTRKGFDSDDHDSEEEVYGVLSSDDEKDDDDENIDSDIEENDDDLPDARAWGKSKKIFYSTDYVDQDYGGFQGKDAEEADYEEQEARAIQERLAKQLDDQDFSFDTFISEKKTSEDYSLDPQQQLIKTDLSKMSKRQKLSLFEKDSPEFFGLVADFKDQFKVLREKLEPTIAIIKEKNIPHCPATSFVKTKYHLALNYCTNISFYLVLKARCRNVKTHPIIRRLVQYRQLLQQLAPLWTDIMEPQVDQLLEMHRDGQEIQVLTNITRSTGRQLLNVLKTTSASMDQDDDDELTSKSLKKETGKKKERTAKSSKDAVPQSNMDQSAEEEGSNIYQDGDLNEEEVEGNEEAKRAITYQIAKNKGLTPHRKKEQRNPRVKNRNKYRKAQIQRRGQVRTVRKETERYGGEISGIKAGIKKGIKIKV